MGSNAAELNISPSVLELVSSAEEESPVVIEEDSRVVCHQYRPTGSHRLVKYCQTVEEFREDKQRSQNFIRAFGNGSKR